MIVTAAIRTESGLIVHLPRPARHEDIRRSLDESGDHGVLEWGFLGWSKLANKLIFLDRQRAARWAIQAGQVKAENVKCNTLLSEDLW